MIHYIENSTIQLDLASRQDVNQIEDRFSQIFWADLKHQMEVIFDQVSQKEFVTCIDHLEIDLGTVQLDQLGKEHFMRMFSQKLREQVQSAMDSYTIQQVNIQGNYFTSWIEFLTHGTVTGRNSLQYEFEESLLIEWLTTNPTAKFKLKTCLQTNHVARERLILQFSPSFLWDVVRQIVNHDVDVLADFLEQWMTFTETECQKVDTKAPFVAYLQTLQFQFWEAVFASIGRIQKSNWQEHAMQVVIAWINQIQGDHKILLTTGLRSTQPLVRQVFELVRQKGMDLIIDSAKGAQFPETHESGEIENNDLQGPKVRIQPLPEDEDQTSNAMPHKLDESSDKGIDSESKEDSSQDQWHINNAGIVLLHPYLLRFWQYQGYIENQQFKSHACRVSAVHTLHYLATQQIHPPESQLVLQKVICGLPIHQPVDRFLDLEPAVLEEADHLLQAVVRNWGALGQVSNTSLQEGFLQREGKLVRHESRWNITIERKTIDILLDQLPWNLSIVHLPWMEDVLWVNWV